MAAVLEVVVVAAGGSVAERVSTGVVVPGLVALVLAAGCTAPPRTNGAPALRAVVVAHHDTELPPALSDAEHVAFRAGTADDDGPPVLVIAAGRPGAEPVDLTPRRPNGQVEHGPRRDGLVEQRLADLDATVDRAAATTSSVDLLAAIGQAVRLGATEVHVLTAGLSSTDPFDMRVIGFDADPSTLAADLARTRTLPDAAGRTIVLSGLGRVAGRQPPLDEAAQRALRDQWLAACWATGATCVLDDGPRALRPDVTALLQGPVVAVPRAHTRATPDGGEEISLPSSVLFGPGSCAFRDPAGASGMLAEVALRLRRGSTATVSGRTAPVGPGDGVDLATCRARAVADLLLAGGAPATALTRITGDGAAADPPGASRDATGHPDPSTYPGLRRVVLVVGPTTSP